MSSEELSKQKRFPVYTVISLLATVLVEVFMMTDSRPSAHSTNPVAEYVGGFILKVLAVFFGLIANTVAGHVAYKRGEFWGGRIAAFGIVVWLVTLITLRPFAR